MLDLVGGDATLAQSGRISVPVHEMDLAAVNSAMKQLRAGQVDGRIVLIP